jgi:uncharacterized membrane protein
MATAPSGPTKLGVAPNVGGLLCYAPCIGLIFSVVAVIVEKENRFVRFHAFQSLLVHAASLVVWIALMILTLILGLIAAALSVLGTLLFFVYFIGVLGLVIFMMIKAYNGEEYSLPTLGELARSWV